MRGAKPVMSTLNISMPERQQHLQHLWDRRKHENELINHRLSWLWTLQGLLFAAFGLLAKETGTLGRLPISVICFVGIASCLSVGYSVWKGHQELNALKRVVMDLAAHIESALELESPDSVAANGLAFLHPWRFLPWVMLLAWLLLFAWVFGLIG
jgi:hypothetical protein